MGLRIKLRSVSPLSLSFFDTSSTQVRIAEKFDRQNAKVIGQLLDGQAVLWRFSRGSKQIAS